MKKKDDWDIVNKIYEKNGMPSAIYSSHLQKKVPQSLILHFGTTTIQYDKYYNTGSKNFHIKATAINLKTQNEEYTEKCGEFIFVTRVVTFSKMMMKARIDIRKLVKYKTKLGLEFIIKNKQMYVLLGCGEVKK